MNSYEIILGKKSSLFKISLGSVHANDKRAAETVGRAWCDEQNRPQWKRKISARPAKNLRGKRKELDSVL